MADPQELAVSEPEAIRQQMDATRCSLAEKLEELEEKVSHTVEAATAAVTDTVQTVKESVEGSATVMRESVQASVDTVADALNLRLQVERHPWAMMGGSIALGFLGGWMLGEERGPAAGAATDVDTGARPQPSRLESFTPSQPRQAEGPRWLGKLAEALAPEVEKLRGLAIGTLGGVARELLSDRVPPSMRSRVSEVIDDFTTRLGGQPISGPILSTDGTATSPIR